jgi:hypothetical protein
MNNSNKIILISDIINKLSLDKKSILIDFLSQLNEYTLTLRVKGLSFRNNSKEPINDIFFKVYDKILDKNLLKDNDNNNKTGLRISNSTEINRLRCSLPLYVNLRNPILASEDEKLIINKIKQLEEFEFKKRLEKNSFVIKKIEKAFADRYDLELLAALINNLILDVEFYNKKIKDNGLRNNFGIKEFKEIITLNKQLFKCYNSKNNIEHFKFSETYNNL